MSRKSKKESFAIELNSSAAFHIQPKNATQQYLLDSIESSVMTVCIGPAGTGKTFCSGMKTAQLYLKGQYKKIIITRPNISTGKSLGYFPGTVEEKLEPWLKPITSVLEEAMGKGRFECDLRQKRIEIQPLETIRGNSFEDSIILVDEAQNLDLEELKALTTRIGEKSKLVLMGDPNQSDVKNGMALTRFVDMCVKHGIACPIVRFTLEDVVRSDIVKQLLTMFYKEDV